MAFLVQWWFMGKLLSNFQSVDMGYEQGKLTVQKPLPTTLRYRSRPCNPREYHLPFPSIPPLTSNQTDYIYTSYLEVLKKGLAAPLVFPTVSNNLINGKGTSDCKLLSNSTKCTPGAPLAKFAFQTGKVHRLRLINTGSSGTQKFSIDGHQMTIIAQDYVPIKPYTTNVVTLGLGQRADVLVNATGSPDGKYWMRADLDVACMQLETANTHALASVYYPNADTSSQPNSTAYSWESNNCLNVSHSSSINEAEPEHILISTKGSIRRHSSILPINSPLHSVTRSKPRA